MRFLLAMALWSASLSPLQQSQPGQPPEPDKPLPAIEQVMQQVIVRQHASETAQQDYLSHQTLSFVDGVGRCDPYPAKFNFEKSGACLTFWQMVTHEDDHESEVFWLQGIRVSRLLKTKGYYRHGLAYDHELSPDELRLENARIEADLAQVIKARDAGDFERERRLTGLQNDIKVSRFLELGSYSNLRRSNSMGRSAIIVDYTGIACVGACTALDNVLRNVIGTVFIDEEDLEVTALNGHFIDNWIDPENSQHRIVKGSTLEYSAERFEGGVWFPRMMSIVTPIKPGKTYQTHSVCLYFRDYKKFRVTSTILPDVAFVPEQDSPKASPNTEPK